MTMNSSVIKGAPMLIILIFYQHLFFTVYFIFTLNDQFSSHPSSGKRRLAGRTFAPESTSLALFADIVKTLVFHNQNTAIIFSCWVRDVM